MKSVKSGVSRLWQAVLMMWVWGAVTAHAAVSLPTTEAPSTGTNGNTLSWVQGLFKDGTNVVLGLAIVAALVITAWSAIATYAEIQAQRKKWSDLFMHAAAGFCIIIAVIYLVNRANGVL